MTIIKTIDYGFSNRSIKRQITLRKEYNRYIIEDNIKFYSNELIESETYIKEFKTLLKAMKYFYNM